MLSAIPVAADGWAGLETLFFPLSVSCSPTDRWTDGPTDRRMDRWTKPVVESLVRN